MNQQQTPYPGSRNYPNAQGESPKSRTGLWIVLGLLASLIFLAIVAYFTIHIWEQPTCTEPAVCKICGKVSKNSMLGHDWGQVSYVWSADNSAVTARRVCRNDSSHVEEETVNTTVRESTAATCGQDGTRVYTAKFSNAAFGTQTKTGSIGKTGHNWGTVTYTWSKDHSTLTAKRVCKNDSSHVETETVSATSRDDPAPTCQREGKRIYTSAKFKNSAFSVQTETVSLKKTDHRWTDATYTRPKTCSVCGTTEGKPARETVAPTLDELKDLIASGDYVTKSDKNVKLQAPKSSEYLSKPYRAEVYNGKKTGRIYLIPLPENDTSNRNGNLCAVNIKVQGWVVATSGQFSFFISDDGKMGWNGSVYFVKPG